jgi:hypothetical protein
LQILAHGWWSSRRLVTGKSEIVSRRFRAYALGRNPQTDEQLEAIAALDQTIARLGPPEGDAARTEIEFATETALGRR